MGRIECKSNELLCHEQGLDLVLKLAVKDEERSKNPNTLIPTFEKVECVLGVGNIETTHAKL